MEPQRLSDGYLFERHPKEQIRRWVNDLKYSYFKRAWGGHANDGDEFILTLKYTDKNDLLDILKRLGIKLNSLPEDHPKPLSGKSYVGEFKSEISDFPEYEQPKHIDLNGIRCYCWIENGKISFNLSGGQDGDLYEVTEIDFENCKRLEQLVTDKNLTDSVSRDFEDRVTFISRTWYQDLFD